MRLLVFTAIAAALFGSRAAQCQVKELFENDTVRVFEATIKAHTTTPLHTHTVPHVTYVLSGGQLKVHHPDGSTTTASPKTGDVYWGRLETHAVENIGSTDVVLITVDVKPSKHGKQ